MAGLNLQLNLAEAKPPSDLGSASDEDECASPRGARDAEGATLAFLTETNTAQTGSALLNENHEKALSTLADAANRYFDEEMSAGSFTSGSGMTSPVPPAVSALRYTIHFVGQTGAGKTTLKACFTQSVLKSLPETRPSVMSGSSPFYFTSSKKEKIDINLVDNGPVSLTSGGSTLCGPQRLYVMCIALTVIKQMSKKAGGAVLWHSSDKAMLRGQLIELAARASSGCSIALVATHKDLLSDSSRSAIEAILQVFHEFIETEIDQIARHGAPMMRLIGCFAVSCNDHTCVSENRGGPKKMSELWNFLCDLVVKDAKVEANRAAAHAAALRSPTKVNSGSNSLNNTASFSSPAIFNTEHRELDVQRTITGMIRKAKLELGLPIVSTHTLQQAAFAQGNHSGKTLRKVLQELELSTEVHVLEHLSHCNGMQRCVLLMPHLVSRAQHLIASYNSTTGFPTADRERLHPTLNIKECEAADPKALIAKGIIVPKLMVALSACFSTIRRESSARAQLFLLVTLLDDFVVQVMESSNAVLSSNKPAAVTSPTQGPEGAPTEEAAPAGSAAPSSPFDGEASPAATTTTKRRSASTKSSPRPVFVVPSLVNRAFVSTALSTIQAHLEKDRFGFVHHDMTISPCPPSFFGVLTCRVGHFISGAHSIAKNGVVLKSPLASPCAAILYLHDTEGDASHTRKITMLVGASGGNSEALSFASEITKEILLLQKGRFPGIKLMSEGVKQSERIGSGRVRPQTVNLSTLFSRMAVGKL